MVGVRTFIAVGAAALISSAAAAADMPMPQAPQIPMQPIPLIVQQPLGGWYLRGDVGIGVQSFSEFDFTQTNSAFVWPSSWTIVQKDIQDTTIFGLRRRIRIQQLAAVRCHRRIPHQGGGQGDRRLHQLLRRRRHLFRH